MFGGWLLGERFPVITRRFPAITWLSPVQSKWNKPSLMTVRSWVNPADSGYSTRVKGGLSRARGDLNCNAHDGGPVRGGRRSCDKVSTVNKRHYGEFLQRRVRFGAYNGERRFSTTSRDRWGRCMNAHSVWVLEQQEPLAWWCTVSRCPSALFEHRWMTR